MKNYSEAYAADAAEAARIWHETAVRALIEARTHRSAGCDKYSAEHIHVLVTEVIAARKEARETATAHYYAAKREYPCSA